MSSFKFKSPFGLTIFEQAVGIVILVGHLLMYLCGFPFMDINWFFQLIPLPDMQQHFWTAFWYRHGSPAGYSLLIHIFDVLRFGHRNWLLAPFLAVLHAVSYFLLTRTFRAVGIRFAQGIAAVLMLNQPVFLYFNYPSYVTFIFSSSCLMLYALYAMNGTARKFLVVVACLAFCCFIRSTWSFFFTLAAAMALVLHFKPRRKVILYGMLILTVPFFVYFKNYLLFGKFEGSTWLGFSLARQHVPRAAKIHTIGDVTPFGDIANYLPFSDPSDPLAAKYGHIPELNHNDYNNVRCIALSDSLKHYVLKNYKVRTSVETVLLFGVPVLFSSPGLCGHLYNTDWHELPNERYPVWMFDIFELPDIYIHQKSGNVFRLRLSSYTFLYPLALLLILLLVRKADFNLRFIWVLTVFIGITPVLIDPMETNRMRWEVEPFFWFMLFFVLLSSRSPLRKQKVSDKNLPTPETISD